MNANEIFKIIRLSTEALESKIKDFESKNKQLEARLKEYGLSVYNMRHPYLTVNEIMVLLDVFRGTCNRSRHLGTFDKDIKKLESFGYLEKVDDGFIITRLGDLRVRLCKGELK